METPNQFKLELVVDTYLLQLQDRGNYTPDDILELRSHLMDNIDELKQKQLDDEEAFLVAKKRLGKEEVLNKEYRKVNGSFFYNRDLFVIVLSICTYLLFSYLYSISANLLQYIAISSGKNIYLFGAINYALQIVIVGGFIYVVFASKKYLTGITKLFSKSPANFSTIFIMIIVIVYFVDFYLQKMPLHHVFSTVIQERYYQFLINTAVGDMVKVVLGIVVLIAILAAFVTSYKRIKFADNIINNSGYIALFFLGLFWDFVAASARMLNPYLGNETICIVGFGVIWFIGMFFFNFYLKRNYLKRNMVFIAFGFIMEFVAGIWVNPQLRHGLPVSVYFLALIIGGGTGYLFAKIFTKKQKLNQ